MHHGNGIEEIHLEDPRVLYISLHRYTEHFYPGTGAASVVGSGPGRGFNVNIPWTTPGLSDLDYSAALSTVVCPILRAFNADILLISAGYDAVEGDPLGGMLLSPAGYHGFTEALRDCVPSRKVCALLEGGYNLGATARCAEATLRALFGDPPVPQTPSSRRLHSSTRNVLRQVVSVQREFWPQAVGLSHEAVEAACAVGAPTPEKGEATTPRRSPRMPSPKAQTPPAPEDGGAGARKESAHG